MRAFLFFACSKFSRTTKPQPSAITKPSRFRSNGRLAFSGASFLVESAFKAQNPPIPVGTIQLSVPPQIITSASPRSIILEASPMACAPEAQAVATQELGPFNPKLMPTCPAASLTIIMGIRNGDNREGPLFRQTLCCSSIVYNPPIPEPTKTPILCLSSFSKSKPALVIACFAEATAYCTNFSKRLASLTDIPYKIASKLLTSAAIRESKPEASKEVMGPAPLFPDFKASQKVEISFPTGDITPNPVTTTLFFICVICLNKIYPAKTKRRGRT